MPTPYFRRAPQTAQRLPLTSQWLGVPRLCALLALASLHACTFDLDKLYEHTSSSDASLDPNDGSTDEPPEQLIDLYSAHAFVDKDCRACVVKDCRAQNTACREDDQCVQATRCFADAIDPDSHADCREEQLEWFGAEPDARALGGPFYLCAFRDECDAECGTTEAWECLNEYTWNNTSEKSVSLDLRLFDARSGEIGSDITIKVCAAEDVACETPALEDPVVTDKNGKAKVTLPTPLRSFRGYLDLEGEGWFPTLARFSSPIARDGVLPFGIINEQNVRLSIAAVGATPDETRGLLQIRMFGCAGVGMRGVSFTASKADEQSFTWYWDGERPNTEASATEALGSGGIVNVPVGLNEIVAKLGDKVVARTTAPVRAGYMTIVVLSPLEQGGKSSIHER